MDGFKELRSLEPGVFGKVMLVQRKGAPNTFAMRYLQCPDISTLNKLLHQLFLMRAFDHPNVIKYQDMFFEQEGTQFVLLLLMDYYVDGNLYNVINRHTMQDPTPVSYLLSLLSQITNGVAFLHSKGLLHGDLKPSNVLLASNKKRAIVTDFGIAGPVAEGLEVPGIPAYMAPEQAGGKDYGSADLWALGCIALDLMMPGRPQKILYAEALEQGESALHSELRGMLDRQGCWPVDLIDLVLALLSVDSSQRPEASDVYYQLRSFSNNYCPDSVPLITTTAQEYQPRMKDYYGMRQDSLTFSDGTFASKPTERTPVKGSRGGLEVLRALLDLGLEEQQQGRRTSTSRPRSSSADSRARSNAADLQPPPTQSHGTLIAIPDMVVTMSPTDTPTRGFRSSSFGGTSSSLRSPHSGGSSKAATTPLSPDFSSLPKGHSQFPIPASASPSPHQMARNTHRSSTWDSGRFIFPPDQSSPSSANPSPRAITKSSTSTAALRGPPAAEALLPHLVSTTMAVSIEHHPPLNTGGSNRFGPVNAGNRLEQLYSPGLVYTIAPAAPPTLHPTVYHSGAIRTVGGGLSQVAQSPGSLPVFTPLYNPFPPQGHYPTVSGLSLFSPP
eukprot:GGOE01020714.1.p1 GENE.GGOE01020714.1~~GGOE01020714.1.p1  ORF type:complete len:613 (+),score=83.55 GGOE01020714.1:33-1871(+)